MDGKIAIEEHFVTPELEDLVLNPGWPEAAFRTTLDALEDVDGHLEVMDRDGIEIAALSLASDAIQRALLGDARGIGRAVLPAPPKSARVSARDLQGPPELLGPTWAFGVETATHALRLIVSGLFDCFPQLTVILGQLREGSPGGSAARSAVLRVALARGR